MATVYRAPSEFPPPKLDFSSGFNSGFAAYQKAEDEYIARLATAARAQRPTVDLVGEVVRFQIADGYAQYMVWSTRPLQLVWLELGDAYAIPEAHARGLRLSDIKQLVSMERAFAAPS
ncbi:hypothetical protein E4T66_17155 [Sinimarinibacterium sp. CAU 1509]|uniref:hypothetical protein n=1 Tax=Sinimarinibacterium sp. CAU 1509 TaxID=2562283 RepID=UPI0010ACDD58|nr:hypothetical protein [Sinimarinibacterium sp. CAU 1509]TJY57139.1 hypothetical protein E4T66_17155 [Sinimarinibacterium sp. CAU 1509]